MKKFDPYETLGIDPAASGDDVKRAYRKRAMETHPDKGGTPGTFLAVQRAYKTLNDPDKRKKYDETGEADEGGPDNRLTNVMAMLSRAYFGVIASMVQQNADPERECVFDHVLDTLKKAKDKCLAAIETNDKMVKAFKKALKRVRGKGDTFKTLTAGKVREAQDASDAARREIHTIDECVAVVKQFRYEPLEDVMVYSEVNFSQLFQPRTDNQ